MVPRISNAFEIIWSEGGYVLELLNAVNTLRLLRGVHKAAKSSLELLTARSVGHTAQARAVPVNLAGLGVEGAFLAGLGLELLGGLQRSGFGGGLLRIILRGFGGSRSRSGSGSRSRGLLLFADLGLDGVDGEGGFGFDGVGLGLREKRDYIISWTGPREGGEGGV